MQSVTVSPKYQIVIPKEVRETMNLRPGQKVQIAQYEGGIEIIFEKDIQDLRGVLKGACIDFERDGDRI